MEAALIGEESNQADLAAGGAEHNPRVLNGIDEELDRRRPLRRADPESQPPILAGDGPQLEENDAPWTRLMGRIAPGVRGNPEKP